MSASRPLPRWLYFWLVCWTLAILGVIGYFGYYLWANGTEAATAREAVLLTRAASHDGELFPSRERESPPTPTAAPTSTGAAVGAMPTQPPSDPPVRPGMGSRRLPMRSPDYGMQAFLWWRPETAHRDLGMIRDAGFTWV